jgi:hypothetical protein
MRIYLASAYTHPDAAVREIRYLNACEAAARLMQRGYVVFSPIAHSHGISQYVADHDEDFWMAQDLPMLAAADKMIVLMSPGWQLSSGIRKEIEFATEHGVPVEYME